jgi:SagB-type dehydrogenase family enzyme
MKTRIISAFLILPALSLAGALSLDLPAAQTNGGRPLMEVLKARKSSREFSSAKLSPQLLSNLLWAASGVNRPDGHRTAPSASNRQEIDIYVATADGLYLYDARSHRLVALRSEDLRATTGAQSFAGEAPLNLIYVADFARMSAGSEETRILNSSPDTGFISQNVYLFCASEGLATVVRGSVNRPALAKAMGLRPEQRIVLAQSVGYPKK